MSHKTHCLHGHEFTPENVYTHSSTGFRQCRECAREKSRARGKATASRHGGYSASRPAGRDEMSARVRGLLRTLEPGYDNQL